MSTFPECDFFCNDVGRVSIVPSNCGSAESFIAKDCTCAESPVTKNTPCLQSICAPQDFANLVAAEEARCPGVVTRSDQNKPAPNVINAYCRAPAATIWPGEAEATTVRPARVSNSSLEQIGFAMINSTNTAHLGCGSGVTSALASPFVLVLLALALMAVVAAVGTCRRRPAARVYLDHQVMVAESTIEVEKGWMAVA